MKVNLLLTLLNILLLVKDVKWDFNLANAPWYGGFWECLIGRSNIV